MNLCKRGHDKDVVGVHQRMCRECRRMGDRARYATAKYRATNANRQGLRRVRARITATKARILELLKGER